MSTSKQVHELVNTVAEFVKGRLESHIATLESEVAALRAEAEGMREDAERYRWLCDSGDYSPSSFARHGWALRMSGKPSSKSELDAAVDLARKESSK